jgi:hypothetical protein
MVIKMGKGILNIQIIYYPFCSKLAKEMVAPRPIVVREIW